MRVEHVSGEDGGQVLVIAPPTATLRDNAAPEAERRADQHEAGPACACPRRRSRGRSRHDRRVLPHGNPGEVQAGEDRIRKRQLLSGGNDRSNASALRRGPRHVSEKGCTTAKWLNSGKKERSRYGTGNCSRVAAVKREIAQAAKHAGRSRRRSLGRGDEDPERREIRGRCRPDRRLRGKPGAGTSRHLEADAYGDARSISSASAKK